MELRRIKAKRIYENIAEQVKALIAAGNLTPGDKLPPERELAEQLQVSRTSVREALCALDMAGIIEVRPGEGAFVRRVEKDSIIEPLSFILLLEKDKVREILEVRKALEVESVGLATERATDEHFSKIEAFLAEMEEDLLTGNTGERADLKFHYSIAEATGNTLLIRLMNTVYDTMYQTLATTRRLWMTNTAGTPQRLFEEHKSIYLAIKDRDKAKARELMYQHLWKVETELARIYRLVQQADAGYEDIRGSGGF
ncbi:GntR family transcriptional regulator [Clostridiales bacterium PH28_bin88]|nr:GntR family transcriptional regulator [Clostridiales bacterium PH28_bin88]